MSTNVKPHQVDSNITMVTMFENMVCVAVFGRNRWPNMKPIIETISRDEANIASPYGYPKFS